LSAHNRALAEIDVELTAATTEVPRLHTLPFVNSRVIPRWDTAAAEPEVELVTSIVAEQETGVVFEGRTRNMVFREAPGEELARLRAAEVGKAYYFAYAETLLGGGPLR
jgi:hypothetical protein